MNVDEEKVIQIDKNAEMISIASNAKYIGQYSCFNGLLTTLDLENSRIIIIEKYAFSHCFRLEFITFPKSLEEICEGSFQNCTCLEEIRFELDSNLKKIGKKAFYECTNLNKIVFPPSLEEIGVNAFLHCPDYRYIKNNIIQTKIRYINLDSNINLFNTLIRLPDTVNASVYINYRGSMPIQIPDDHKSIKKDEAGYYFYMGTILQGNKNNERINIRRGVEIIRNTCFFKAIIVSVVIPASVTEICSHAFLSCIKLESIKFARNSRLKRICSYAFVGCTSLTKIKFPKSLKYIHGLSFWKCENLEEVIFPSNSELERISRPFIDTKIKRLSLPPSVKSINEVDLGMYRLKSYFIDGDFFKSNEEGTAIYSRDGSELVTVIKSLCDFEIPNNVRIIKENAFKTSNINDKLIIPSSVEVIEPRAFCFCIDLNRIEFAPGSRLKSLGFDSLPLLEDLVINNENFITRDDGVVISLNPKGIVFVPKHLEEIQIDPDIEVIYAFAFSKTKIKEVNFPRSLKIICESAFKWSELKYVSFEEGCELDSINEYAFSEVHIERLKLPLIKGRFEDFSLCCNPKIIEFPSNFNPSYIGMYAIIAYFFIEETICPRSSIPALAKLNYWTEGSLKIIEDQ